ncbi:hypothetical protein LEMLEM_LOCUS25385, partial [Lemmus lemmus]
PPPQTTGCCTLWCPGPHSVWGKVIQKEVIPIINTLLGLFGQIPLWKGGMLWFHKVFTEMTTTIQMKG